jgi:Ca2+:H+ antiporter
MAATLLLLAVAALMLPTLAHELHTPAEPHETTLSAACAIVLLIVFAASVPFSLKGDPSMVCPDGPSRTAVLETAAASMEARAPHPPWPLWLALATLAVAGVGAAFVSEWFVGVLTPTMAALGLSEAFTGLVIVAIAGNAVENVVGIQLAARNKSDYAMSVILNSSLQIALAVTPVLVLLSFFVGATPLTLVLPPLLVAALAISAIVSAMIVFDGESIWLEGVALIGLYAIIAASFWWG